MNKQTCILTSKDITILEVMLDRRLGQDDPLAPLLRSKIDSAQVVFRDGVSNTVATLGSRIAFSLDHSNFDTRVLTHDQMTLPTGMSLPITTARGLALLGLSEGQELELPGHCGPMEVIRLEQVLYQPEAAKREKDALAQFSEREEPVTVTRLVRGAGNRKTVTASVRPGELDDPGPSAA